MTTNGRRSGRPTLGVVLPTFPQADSPDFQHLPDFVRQAEAAGVDALWACDHLFWHGPVFESLTAVAVAASVSTECTVGTAVLQLPLRSSAAVAKACASLQQLSGGRFVLGVGAGVHEGEFQAAGLDYSRRGQLLDEGLDRLDAIWSGGAERYGQLPRPTTVPVWIGGSSDAARRRVVRRGDGWIPMFVSPDGLRKRFDRLDTELLAAGRSPSAVARALLIFVATGNGPDVPERGLAWLSSLYGLPPQAVARHLVAGDPRSCVESLTEYVEAGVEHLCLFVADDDPLPHLEALLGAFDAAGGRNVAVGWKGEG